MSLECKQLGPLGVEVLGLDLRAPVAEDDWRALRELVMREGVVVFRDQPMSAEAQIALGRRFGELENTSIDQRPIDASTILLSNVDAEGRVMADDETTMRLVAINEGWHTDSSFREVPASFSLFAAVVVPEVGGDTFFASLRRGWEALSAEEQSALFGLQALHDYESAYASRHVDLSGFFGGEAPSATHPLVRRHPETGETALFVSEHVFAIEGMPDAEARALAERLVGVCTDPARQYRHAWAVGDLVIWDNRTMLHRAEGFDPRYARVMRHVRVAGEGGAIAATA